MAKKSETMSVAQRLRDLKHASPFAPFQLKTVRGESFTVAAADDFIVSPLGNTGFFNPKGSNDMRFLQLRDVRAVSVLRDGGRRTNPRSKGKGRR
jgi:hypothetical protein